MIVSEDLFDICKRVKEIDEDYFVVFNERLERYEIHNKKQQCNTLAIVVPYDRLDKRVLDKLNETKIERKEEIYSMLENQNKGEVC